MIQLLTMTAGVLCGLICERLVKAVAIADGYGVDYSTALWIVRGQPSYCPPVKRRRKAIVQPCLKAAGIKVPWTFHLGIVTLENVILIIVAVLYAASMYDLIVSLSNAVPSL